MTTETQSPPEHVVEELDRVTIRFAGDSGDGMQLTGTQFTKTAAVFGNDLATLPDYPGRNPGPYRLSRQASPASRFRFPAPTSAPPATSQTCSSR